METLSPVDASFLHLENDVSHMHIGSLALLEGPPPPQEELLDRVTSRLGLVPRYRQRVRMLPLSLGRPVWIDDPYFNLIYHVRRTALPSDGTDADLQTLMGRVMSQQLDRSKPLWEMWFVEGIEGDRWGMINKLHHCMVDGVAGTDLITHLFDTDADRPAGEANADATANSAGSIGRRSRVPIPWRPEPVPGDARLVLGAVGGRLTDPYEMVRTAWSAARGPRRTMREAVALGRAVGTLGGLLRPAAPTLNGPIGPHRRWAWARADLADIKTIRGAHGGTINDVVLALVARGYRDLLTAREVSLSSDVVVRAMVPVSVRSVDQRGTYNNKISAMFANLPVGLSDPVARLDDLRRQMDGLKERRQAMAAAALTSLGGFAPAMLLDVAMRVSIRAPQRSLSTVATNVPGPQRPMYLLGRRMLDYLPFVPLVSSLRTGVAIVSYDGQLGFGVTADWDTTPDIHILSEGIEAGVSELLATVSTGVGA